MERDGLLPCAMFWGSCHLSLSWATCNQSTPSHPVSLWSILVLSSHLSLSLPGGLFPSGCSTSYTFLFSLCIPHAMPISDTLILLPAYPRWLTEYYWDDQSKEDGMLGHVACMVHVRNASAVILRKPEGKMPLGLVYMGEYYYSWCQRYVLADLA